MGFAATSTPATMSSVSSEVHEDAIPHAVPVDMHGQLEQDYAAAEPSDYQASCPMLKGQDSNVTTTREEEASPGSLLETHCISSDKRSDFPRCLKELED